MSSHFNIFELTSFVLNDLSKDKKERVEKHIFTCTECSSRIETIKMEQSSFLKKFPNPPQIKEDKSNIINVSHLYWKKLIPLAAILIFTVTLTFLYYQSSSNNLKQLTHGIKGNMGVTLFVQKSDNSIEQREKHIYYPQEKIQIKYSSSDYQYLISLSMDSSGNIYTYCPQDSDSSFKIEKGADIPLPNSITLDDYIGKELFITVFSKEKVSVPKIKSVIKREFNMKKDLKQLNFNFRDDIQSFQILITKNHRYNE